jgi:radical SAM/Cys-rich protein
MQLIIDKTDELNPSIIDITGGAPELNPHLKKFVKTIHEHGYPVQVRTNLTILFEPRMEHMITFYRNNGVKLVASFPCYLQKEVDFVRGNGTFKKSIEVLKRLNNVGYGVDPHLKLDLVFNPEGAFLPAPQAILKQEYQVELQKKYGIVFNNLITITNMPIGRFSEFLHQQNLYGIYRQLLRESFNVKTLDRLMCRHQVNIGWDGVLYDCDFNLGLQRPIDYGGPSQIDVFDVPALSRRRIVTGEHCFGCTAGNGSSCGGALVE